MQVAVLTSTATGADGHCAELRAEEVECGCVVHRGPDVFRIPILQGWDFSYISYRAALVLVMLAVAV